MIPVATRGLALACARRSGVARVAPRVLASQQQQRTLLSTDSRPTSPHVFIYAWPLAAISSITTRITGVMLTAGVYGIGFGSLVGADMGAVMAAMGASGIGPLVKFGVAFPLSYHFMGAARHFYLEKNPAVLDPEFQKNTSVGIFAAAGVVSLASMVV